MEKTKHIALVAHDTCKKDLVNWVESHWEEISKHDLVCTGTTGRLVEEAIVRKHKEAGHSFPIRMTKLKSGPLGGDQQLGAMIAENKIDIVIFLWDPMQPQPHDVDVKALLRLIVLYNVIAATSTSTADFIITSPLFDSEYKVQVKDYSGYVNRKL
ncbi:MAG TPA: methylglyoxal synthase [Bacteroidales bacterium]|nr:methylglyoxal synthase [Bacteroidales bacterium]